MKRYGSEDTAAEGMRNVNLLTSYLPVQNIQNFLVPATRCILQQILPTCTMANAWKAGYTLIGWRWWSRRLKAWGKCMGMVTDGLFLRNVAHFV